MKRKRFSNPLHQALEIWNRLPQYPGSYFGLSLALDDRLRVFRYDPARLKTTPKQILNLSREGDEQELEFAGLTIHRDIHRQTSAPVVLSLKAVSTLLGAYYWKGAGRVDLPEGNTIPLLLNPESTALLSEGHGLFVWGQELEAVRARVAELEFWLSYQIQLLSLPEQSTRGPILDGGWRIPPLPQARGGVFSL
jgi:hypothetical protein